MRKTPKKSETLKTVENFPIGEGVLFVDLSDFLENSYVKEPPPKTLVVLVQSRFKSDPDWIEEIAHVQDYGNEKGKPWNWDKEPPLLVGPEEGTGGTQIFYLVDGIHRFKARLSGNHDFYPKVQIMSGDRQSALTEACGPAAKESAYPEQPRNREDKKRSVLLLIQFPEWWSLSDREIERRLNHTVSHTHIQNMREYYLKILGNPEELKRWNLQPVEEPEQQKKYLEELNNQRTFTDKKGKERVRRKKEKATSLPSEDKVAEDSDNQDLNVSLAKRRKSLLSESSCTFTLDADAREKAMEIATKNAESIQGFFTRVIHSYPEWMNELAILRSRLASLEATEQIELTSFEYGQDSRVQISDAHKGATKDDQLCWLPSEHRNPQIAIFSGKREKIADVYSESDGILSTGYTIRPNEQFEVIGELEDNGYLKLKVVPLIPEDDWNEDYYLAIAPKDLIFASDEVEAAASIA